MNGSRFNTVEYQRPRFFPPVIKWLLALNVLIFFLGWLQIGTYPDGSAKSMMDVFLQWGALWPLNNELFRPWQYFTTMFLHGGLFHLGINMFILWMFGMEIENLWGSRRFAVFYLLSGIGASIIHSLVTMSDQVQAPAVGASGAIFGVMVAFGMLFPNRLVFVGFFFPMRAKWAVLLFIALDLFAGISDQPGDNVAHFAHLGGALTGFLLLKTQFHSWLISQFKKKNSGHRFQSPPPDSPGRSSTGGRQQSSRVVDARYRDMPTPDSRTGPIDMDFGEQQERIDEILDKISREGYASLTQEEREILLEVSKSIRSN